MSAKCPYCGKTPRSKLAKANAARYAPYCSFHCQEWANLHRAAAYVRTLSPESASQCDEHDHTKSDPVAAHGEPVAVEEALRWADNLADLDFLNDVKVLAAEVRRLRAADRKDAARLRFLLETDDTDDAGLWAEIASLSGIDADAARAAIDAAMSDDVRGDFVSPVSSPDQTLPAPSAVAQWQPIESAPRDERKVIIVGGHYGGAWHTEFSDSDDIRRWMTHWMPLPQPPADVRSQAKEKP